MRTVVERDKVVCVSAVFADGDVDVMLPSAARPQSVQLWINGLRATDLEPDMVDGQHARVDGLIEGDVISITYVPVS